MNQSIAIITGAGSGLGQHLAQTLFAQGYHLYLTDINLENTRKLFPAQETIRYEILDVRDRDAWQQLLHTVIDDFGSIDYLFNMAGIIQPGFIFNAELDLVDRHIDINAKGSIYGTKIIGDYMKARGRGHIINIASLAGIAPVPGIAYYTASKFAIRGFSLAAAYEYEPFGVAVSVVCPDLVKTPMLDLQLNFQDETDLVFSGNSRPLQPADVTCAILALMKSKKREISIPASRGLLARLASIWPSLADLLRMNLLKKGRRNKARLQGSKPS